MIVTLSSSTGTCIQDALAELSQSDLDEELSARAFGLKIKLVKKLLNGLGRTLTLTNYLTSVTTVQALATSTCFTRTMFAATTTCQRRRRALDNISIGNVETEVPSGLER